MSVSENSELHSRKQYTKYILIIGAFFFIFGFVSWINATLIPYLKIACELEDWQAYLVPSAFYIAYTVMAFPTGYLLQRTGMVKGISAGLYVMAFGCLLFVPAAMTRSYLLFLVGLFITGTGLTVLQSAVNPYITLLGPRESAARRISIMGICNKTAGIIAPLIMGSIILKNSDKLIADLATMGVNERSLRLNQLAQDVIVPYCILASIWIVVAILIRFAHLPEIKSEPLAEGAKPAASRKNWQFFLGFTAIFFAVGVEVLAGDTISNYGQYHGLGLDFAKNLSSYTLGCMMVGYLVGIAVIPRVISQQKAFYISSLLGLVISFLIIFIPGKLSIAFVAALGFANAMLWAAIWPQALKGLSGKQLSTGAAVLIMGIAGGALLPPVFGWLTKEIGHQQAYWILIPCYIFLIYYSILGKKDK
ncbi:sugar MFS transporter [Terrimonas sp. NA20]|uniref:Sugar MFS transporter n=1 Tax=Terrimonas ginsenosidimutans TaxID=2908004 RepID=A0ABS9KU55_9BACT|nr:sugar MFS transporter [Terrimonas ginsenosidimutans]MCG2615860.1 sugar MFS transporter [Terrimonas ginsenosidimutans]